ncbi:MAG: DegT/DnrJ/EryC1/StrS family aminotransferase [Anaerolineae bacterium]|jgi:dTDP-4-amino-4,6-dideoxygalactose transaminase
MPGPGMELIGEEEKREALEVLESGHLYRYGREDDPRFQRKVWRLEREVAEMVGVPYAVAVNSGTSALLTALAALGVGPGDEVIVPGYTFVASMSAVVYSRAVPVLAEVDQTLNLDPSDVEHCITPRTKAILAVHMLGNPARLQELRDLADRKGLILLEDCAQAFGASYRGRMVGTIGEAGIYSFNVYKTITAGDGGMVVTADQEIYRRAFAFHDQGHSPGRVGVEVGHRPMIGLDFRMTELAGAVLRAQLRRLPGILAHLRANKARFKAQLQDIPGLEFREITDPEGELATILTLLLPDEKTARAVAADLGTKVVADSGWHVYSNMEQILEQRTVTPEGCPFRCPIYQERGGSQTYRQGMLPQTDALLARAINVSIGVVDAGLGSAFGVKMGDGPEEVDAKAEQLRGVLARYL